MTPCKPLMPCRIRGFPSSGRSAVGPLPCVALRGIKRSGGLLRYSLGMLQLVRAMFVWLLVLALPVQGWAAATMASCNQHHSTASHAVADGHDVHTPVDHGHVLAGAADAPSSDADSAHASAHSCSACAACCSVGALPSPVLTVPVDAAAPTVFAAVQPAVGVFAVDGPERPPRQACA